MKTRNELFNNYIYGLEQFVDKYVEEYGFLIKKEENNDKKTMTLFDGYNTKIEIKTKLQNKNVLGDKHCRTLTLHEYTLNFHLDTEIKVTSNDTEEIDCIINEWRFFTGMAEI